MHYIQEQAKAKLSAYRNEASLRRQLPKKLWRIQAARVLRDVAEWLEPTALPTMQPEGLKTS